MNQCWIEDEKVKRKTLKKNKVEIDEYWMLSQETIHRIERLLGSTVTNRGPVNQIVALKIDYDRIRSLFPTCSKNGRSVRMQGGGPWSEDGLRLLRLEHRGWLLNLSIASVTHTSWIMVAGHFVDSVECQRRGIAWLSARRWWGWSSNTRIWIKTWMPPEWRGGSWKLRQVLQIWRWSRRRRGQGGIVAFWMFAIA